MHIEIVWMTPENEDADLQAVAIAQAVKDRASAILISCSDADKVTGAINEAVDRGVPVMTFDSDAAQSKRFAFYGVDDEQLGRAVMRELAGQLRKKGSVAILAGNAAAPNLRKRVDGVKKEAALNPGITIVGTFNHAETARDAAEEVIRAQKANPQIQGWAMIGGWALFTPRLMKELDPQKVKVVAVNALPAQLAYVESGLAPVLLALPTYNWGYVSVQRIVDKVQLKQDVPTIIPPMEAGTSHEGQPRHLGAPDADLGRQCPGSLLEDEVRTVSSILRLGAGETTACEASCEKDPSWRRRHSCSASSCFDLSAPPCRRFWVQRSHASNASSRTGFTMCSSNPLSRVRCRSLSWPYPVMATSSSPSRPGRALRRCATSNPSMTGRPRSSSTTSG